MSCCCKRSRLKSCRTACRPRSRDVMASRTRLRPVAGSDPSLAAAGLLNDSRNRTVTAVSLLATVLRLSLPSAVSSSASAAASVSVSSSSLCTSALVGHNIAQIVVRSPPRSVSEQLHHCRAKSSSIEAYSIKWDPVEEQYRKIK